MSISVCPLTIETYQYQIGVGHHEEKIDNNKTLYNRTIKLYGTNTNNEDEIKEIIELFFDSDYSKFEDKINNLDFFDEIEDVYFNLNSE